MKIKAVVLAGLLAVSCYASDESDNGVFIDYDSFVDTSLLTGIADAYCFESVISKTEKEMSEKGKKLNDDQMETLEETAIKLCVDYLTDNMKFFVKQKFDKGIYRKGREYGEKIFYEINNE